MITGNVNCEASYYNEGLSIWEPILEPLENKNGRQQLWDVNIDVSIVIIILVIILRHA